MTSMGTIDKKYDLIKKIGSGGTSKVYLGVSKDKQEYAIKIIKPSNSSDSKVFLNEINMLKQVKSENVVKIIDGGDGEFVKEGGKKYKVQYIVLELIKYGELFDYIFFPGTGFGEEVGKYIFTQLINGLEACHKAGISHRDMKTENVMLGENWTMKIADFGFSTKTEGKKGTGLLYTALGTASYASPELLQKKPYLGEPSDIFSLGVSLFVLVTGKMPFKHALTDDPYYKEIVKEDFEGYWEKLKGKVPSVTKEFKELFFSIISYDPKKRPSLEELRKSKWMSSYKEDLKMIDLEFSKRTKIVKEKKELERKKEEEEKRNQEGENRFKYKNQTNEYIPTKNDLAIRVFDEEVDLNQFIARFPKETQPGDFMDYILFKFSDNKQITLKKKDGEKYKIEFEAIPKENDDLSFNCEQINDGVYGQIEIMQDFDQGLVLYFSKESGNKNDFYVLFNQMEKIICK